MDGQAGGGEPEVLVRLGFLLLGVFPTDILTSWAVGTYLSNHGDPWWHLLPFVLLTLLLLALPALLLLLFGQRAQTFLPKARDWMNTALVGRQLDRDRVLRRHHREQPPGLAATLGILRRGPGSRRLARGRRRWRAARSPAHAERRRSWCRTATVALARECGARRARAAHLGRVDPRNRHIHVRHER